MNIWLEKYQELDKEKESSCQLAEGEWIVDIPEKLMLAGQHVPYSEMTQVYDEQLPSLGRIDQINGLMR